MRSADRSFGEFPALPMGPARASAVGGIASAGAVGAAGGVRPAAGAGAETPKFGALYQQLQREVTRYIEQGSDGSGSLSPEGAWRRQQMAAGEAAGSTAAWGQGSALLDETVASSALRGTNAAWTGATAATASPAQQQAFVNDVLPLAREAASRLGVAPEVLTAQAALETGWGRAPIRRQDGSSSHNFFGIKAGGTWSGDVTVAATTEVENGQAVGREASFRAYASPAQSFDDLASLLQGSPRYQAALGTGADARAYGQALQRGGYATDPAYADKLSRVAARIQGATP
jgi:flagellar protein FlgJ